MSWSLFAAISLVFSVRCRGQILGAVACSLFTRYDSNQLIFDLLLWKASSQQNKQALKGVDDGEGVIEKGVRRIWSAEHHQAKSNGPRDSEDWREHYDDFNDAFGCLLLGLFAAVITGRLQQGHDHHAHGEDIRQEYGPHWQQEGVQGTHQQALVGQPAKLRVMIGLACVLVVHVAGPYDNNWADVPHDAGEEHEDLFSEWVEDKDQLVYKHDTQAKHPTEHDQEEEVLAKGHG